MRLHLAVALRVTLMTYFVHASIATSSTPGAPTLRFGTPLENSIEVYVEDTFCATVSQWMIQCQAVGSAGYPRNVSTQSDNIYAARIENLEPNTDYQFRARASQLYGNTTLNDGEALFSSWTTLKTKPLSVFGSVVLNNVAYTAQQNVENSAEWNSTLAIIENGYLSISNEGISLIRVEDSGGKARVHYRIKIRDKSFNDSNTNYTLSGADFSESYINNGDKPLGTPYMYKDGNKWVLFYLPLAGTTCPKLVERYIMVSPDDGPSLDIHLNVASSEATTADQDNSLIIGRDGSLRRDDGISVAQMSPGTVIGLSPRFLIKDCVVGQPSIPLYSEVFEATDANDASMVINHVYETIASSTPTVNISGVTYTMSYFGTSVTIHIPAVEKAIEYAVLNSSSFVVAPLVEQNIECPAETVEIVVESLVSNTNYTFLLRVTTRNKNGRDISSTPSSISITTIPPNPTTQATTQPITTTENPTTTPSPTTATEIPTTTSSPTTTTEGPTTTPVATTVFESTTTTPVATTAFESTTTTPIATTAFESTATTTPESVTTKLSTNRGTNNGTNVPGWLIAIVTVIAVLFFCIIGAVVYCVLRSPKRVQSIE